METTPGQDWRPTSKTEPIQPLDLAGLELQHLTGYLMVAILATLCLLLSVWSRLDFRETAVALDEANRAYNHAMAEHAQLELELASLSDPTWLRRAAADLELDANVEVVDLGDIAQ